MIAYISFHLYHFMETSFDANWQQDDVTTKDHARDTL